MAADRENIWRPYSSRQDAIDLVLGDQMADFVIAKTALGHWNLMCAIQLSLKRLRSALLPSLGKFSIGRRLRFPDIAHADK